MALGDSLSGENRNAFEALNQTFSNYGLQSLAPKIFDMVQKGYSADTISILLQDTEEYKQRFAGNEKRKAAGLPVLSPAEYLSTESSYRQLMRQAGLPAGFYDQPDDFNSFIAKDLSPSELKSRVDMASQATTLANVGYKKALQEMYGIDDAHVTAYFLDPDRAVPLLQKQAAAAAIGAEALKRGLQTNTGRMEQFATAGVTAQQAAQAYGQIAMQLPEYQTFAHQTNENVSQLEFERTLFEDNTTGANAGSVPAESPQAKLERLASWNRARAQGRSGGAQGGLARNTSGVV